MAVKLPLGRSTFMGWSNTFSVCLPRRPTMTVHLRTMHRPGREVNPVNALRPVIVSPPRDDRSSSDAAPLDRRFVVRRPGMVLLLVWFVDSSPVSITPSVPTALVARNSVTAPPDVCSWTLPKRLRVLCNCIAALLPVSPKPPVLRLLIDMEFVRDALDAAHRRGDRSDGVEIPGH